MRTINGVILDETDVLDLLDAMEAVSDAINALPCTADEFVGPGWRRFESWQARLAGGVECERCQLYAKKLYRTDEFAGLEEFKQRVCDTCLDALIMETEDE